MSVRDYNATPSSNTTISSIDIAEGCSPSGINNAIRQQMADLKDVSTGAVALESPKFDSILDGNIKATDASGTDTAGTATTIKGGAGTGTGAGGSIIFQVADGAGSTGSSVNAHATAMTITDDGNVDIAGGLNVGTIKEATGTNTAMTIDSSGIVSMPNTVMVDMWRLTTSFSTNSAVVTGWEQPDHALHSNVGLSMSESSGVFTFPRTGLYRVTGVFFMTGASGDTSYGVVMQGCTNGSSFGAIADGFENSNANSNLVVTDLVNITDTANRKIRFVTSGLNSGTSVGGETNRNRTSVTFERLADSQ